MEKLAEISPTKYAKAERISPNAIDYQREVVEEFLSIKPIIDDVDHMFIIMNKQRQLVYANKLFYQFVESDEILSQRLGEALKCIHSTEEIGGCGTSENCAECGAVNSILTSMRKGVAVEECRITSEQNKVYDLKVWSKKLTIGDNDFTLTSITDISSEKRRVVLERLFFHDILNTAGSLRSFLEIMQDASPDEIVEFSKISYDIANSLIDELKAQRMLGLAEDAKLYLDITEFNPYTTFEDVCNSYKNKNYYEGKKIVFLNQMKTEMLIKSDKTLLRRVLGNLIKNALEASEKDSTVSLGIEVFDSTIVFSVNNKSYMPKDIQLQIFQRSFSTKGTGRGIGTYSVKLLTEKYLHGTVSFFSTEEYGTTFYVTLPKVIN